MTMLENGAQQSGDPFFSCTLQSVAPPKAPVQSSTEGVHPRGGAAAGARVVGSFTAVVWRMVNRHTKLFVFIIFPVTHDELVRARRAPGVGFVGWIRYRVLICLASPVDHARTIRITPSSRRMCLHLYHSGATFFRGSDGSFGD